MGWLGKLKQTFFGAGNPLDRKPENTFQAGTLAIDNNGEKSILRRAVGIQAMRDQATGEIGFIPFIEAGAPLPASRTETFSTSGNYMEQLIIHLMTSGGPLDETAKTLRKIALCGIPPEEMGLPRIEVTFAVDESGNCWIWAKDKRKGNKIEAIGMEQCNQYFDDMRRAELAVRVGSFAVTQNTETPTGRALGEDVTIETGYIRFDKNTMLPNISNQVYRLPATREAKKTAVDIHVTSESRRIRLTLDVPEKTRLIKSTHFLDDAGTYWHWAKDMQTGERLPASREESPARSDVLS